MFEKIKSVLGTPYYENEKSIIYNMDCSEGLELLNGKIKINSTITSPPYNIGKEYENILALDNYVDWLVSICQQIYDITKSNGSFILNVGYLKIEGKGRAVPIPYLIWDKIPFYLTQEIVWNYGAGVACRKYLSPRNEKILWYIKNEKDYTFNLDPIRDPNVKYPNQKKNGKLRCNPLGKNPSDVWQIAKVTSGKNRASKERMPHPAQFPEELISKTVLGFTNENDLILDPFMGSGTTARVAMLHNRKSIGFELNTDYCKTIKHRLEMTEKEIKHKEQTLTLF
ncbi:MAG: site-specific DNA-methyltransferase [Saprospiraceae bacterium]